MTFQELTRPKGDSNIYDGSSFTQTCRCIQNVIGDSFRGACWVSIHNGGGVGWGEVINGGFGMLRWLKTAVEKLKMMLHWDQNNGIARRSWARNEEAIFAIEKEMERTPELKVTLPNIADKSVLNSIDW